MGTRGQRLILSLVLLAGMAGAGPPPTLKRPGLAATTGGSAGGLAVLALAHVVAWATSGAAAEVTITQDAVVLSAYADQAGSAAAATSAAANTGPPDWPWYVTHRSMDQRVDALLERLSPQHKVQQLQTRSSGIPELGVPKFSWQAECLHSFAAVAGDDFTHGNATRTIFPISIALAASFDDQLAYKTAGQVGDELRMQYNQRLHSGAQPLAFSNFLGPNVNVARDPRWGLVGETWGEDPLLNARLAVAFVAGLQGTDGTYYKAAAACQGAFPSGNVSIADLRDTYLPPLEACVRDGRAAAVMCSYDKDAALPRCTDEQLLTGLLRNELGFQGLVMADCRGSVNSLPRSVGSAIRAGIGITCQVSNTPEIVPERDLDAAVRRVLRARLRQGHFNPSGWRPYEELGAHSISIAEHTKTAKLVAAKGAVLLKNAAGLLPLNSTLLRKVAVIGPFSDTPAYILGSHSGFAARDVITPLQALKDALPEAEVLYNSNTALQYSAGNAAADAASCQAADACVLFLGNRMATRHSNMAQKFSSNAYDGFVEGDGLNRGSLKLPKTQEMLWQRVVANSDKPVIVVLITGGPTDVSDMHESARVGAILCAWHPGQAGAAAIVSILLGSTSPSGRLPVTWHRDSYTESVHLEDPRFRASKDFPGRTYRYWRGEAPLYQFGHGLSYATFKFSLLDLHVDGNSSSKGAAALVGVTVRNSGGGRFEDPADTSVLLFMSYQGPDYARFKVPGLQASLTASGCSPAASRTDLVERLVGYGRTGELPVGAAVRLKFYLRMGPGSASSWAGFGDPDPPCGAYTLRFGLDSKPAAMLVLRP